MMVLAQVIGIGSGDDDEGCIDKINNDDDGTMVGLTGFWCIEMVM
jgi:hypothetical protein